MIFSLMQEITLHARLTTTASKEAINLDYIKYLRNTIIRPLAVDGIENIAVAIDVMNHYHLLRLIFHYFMKIKFSLRLII